MDFLGIGPLELIFIILIMLIVLGPTDMVKAGRTVGRFIRKIVTSDTWHMVQSTSRNLRNLPNTLAREAGIEEIEKMRDDLLKSSASLKREMKVDVQKDAVKQETNPDFSSWTTPPDLPDKTDGQSQETPTEEAETESPQGSQEKE